MLSGIARSSSRCVGGCVAGASAPLRAAGILGPPQALGWARGASISRRGRVTRCHTCHALRSVTGPSPNVLGTSGVSSGQRGDAETERVSRRKPIALLASCLSRDLRAPPGYRRFGAYEAALGPGPYGSEAWPDGFPQNIGFPEISTTAPTMAHPRCEPRRWASRFRLKLSQNAARPSHRNSESRAAGGPVQGRIWACWWGS